MPKYEDKISKRYDNDLKKGIAFFNNQDYSKAKNLLRRCFQYYKKKGQLKMAYVSLEKYLIILITFGEYNIAFPKVEEFLDYSKKVNNKEFIALSWGFKGMIFKNQGNFLKSIEFTEKARNIFQELRNWDDLSKTFLNIGNSYYYLGEYEKSLNNYLDAENVCREHNILGNLSRIYQVTSYTYLAMKNNEKFKEYYAKTLEYFDQIKDSTSKAEILNNLSVPPFYTEEMSDSVYQNLMMMLEYSENLNIYSQKVKTLRNIAGVLMVRKKYKESIDYFNKALVLSEKHNNQIDIAYIFNNMALVYSETNNSGSAIQVMKKSIEISKKYNILPLIINGYMILGEIHKADKNFEKSYRYYREALDHYQKIEDKFTSFEQKENYRKSYQELPKVIKELNDLIELNEIEIPITDIIDIHKLSKNICSDANRRYPNLIREDCENLEFKNLLNRIMQQQLEEDARKLFRKKNYYGVLDSGLDFTLTPEDINNLYDQKCLRDKISKTIEIDLFGSKNDEEIFILGETTILSLEKLKKKIKCFYLKANIIGNYHITHSEKLNKKKPKFHIAFISLRGFPSNEVLNKIKKEYLKLSEHRIFDIEFLDYENFYKLLGKHHIKRDKYKDFMNLESNK